MESARIFVDVGSGQRVTYDVLVDPETGMDVDPQSGDYRTREETEEMVRTIYSIGESSPELQADLDRYNKWRDKLENLDGEQSNKGDSSAKHHRQSIDTSHMTAAEIAEAIYKQEQLKKKQQAEAEKLAKEAAGTAQKATNQVEDISGEADKLKLLGNDAIVRKDYAKALELYSRAIDLDDGNPVYWSNRAEVCLRVAAAVNNDDSSKSSGVVIPSSSPEGERKMTCSNHTNVQAEGGWYGAAYADSLQAVRIIDQVTQAGDAFRANLKRNAGDDRNNSYMTFTIPSHIEEKARYRLATSMIGLHRYAEAAAILRKGADRWCHNVQWTTKLRNDIECLPQCGIVSVPNVLSTNLLNNTAGNAEVLDKAGFLVSYFPPSQPRSADNDPSDAILGSFPVALLMNSATEAKLPSLLLPSFASSCHQLRCTVSAVNEVIRQHYETMCASKLKDRKQEPSSTKLDKVILHTLRLAAHTVSIEMLTPFPIESNTLGEDNSSSVLSRAALVEWAIEAAETLMEGWLQLAQLSSKYDQSMEENSVVSLSNTSENILLTGMAARVAASSSLKDTGECDIVTKNEMDVTSMRKVLLTGLCLWAMTVLIEHGKELAAIVLKVLSMIKPTSCSGKDSPDLPSVFASMTEAEVALLLLALFQEQNQVIEEGQLQEGDEQRLREAFEVYLAELILGTALLTKQAHSSPSVMDNGDSHNKCTTDHSVGTLFKVMLDSVGENEQKNQVSETTHYEAFSPQCFLLFSAPFCVPIQRHCFERQSLCSSASSTAPSSITKDADVTASTTEIDPPTQATGLIIDARSLTSPLQVAEVTRVGIKLFECDYDNAAGNKADTEPCTDVASEANKHDAQRSASKMGYIQLYGRRASKIPQQSFFSDASAVALIAARINFTQAATESINGSHQNTANADIFAAMYGQHCHR